MPGADLFSQFGFFIAKRFLPLSLCEAVIVEAEKNEGKQATVWKADQGYVVDPKIRRVEQVNLEVQSMDLLSRHLERAKPLLEGHFKVSLQGFELPRCLSYREGDFYAPHRDNIEETGDSPRSLATRKVSVVAFLNGAKDPLPQGYRGGELNFFGLLSKGHSVERGISLLGEPGLLVAFASDRLHQVSAVSAGRRYTIVSWFY